MFNLPLTGDEPPLFPRKRNTAKCCGIVLRGPLGWKPVQSSSFKYWSHCIININDLETTVHMLVKSLGTLTFFSLSPPHLSTFQLTVAMLCSIDNNISLLRKTLRVGHLIHMGYWPIMRSRWLNIGQVFFCVYGLRWRQSSTNLPEKKRTRPLFCHLAQTSLASEKFIIWFWGDFSRRTQWVVSSGPHGTILPAWVAYHSSGFGLSCLFVEIAI